MCTPTKPKREPKAPYTPQKGVCPSHTYIAGHYCDCTYLTYTLLKRTEKQNSCGSKNTVGKHHCHSHTFSTQKSSSIKFRVNIVSRLHTSTRRSFDKGHLNAVHWEVNDLIHSLHHILEDQHCGLSERLKYQRDLDNIQQLQKLLMNRLKVKRRCPKWLFEHSQNILQVEWLDPSKKLF